MTARHGCGRCGGFGLLRRGRRIAGEFILHTTKNGFAHFFLVLVARCRGVEVCSRWGRWSVSSVSKGRVLKELTKQKQSSSFCFPGLLVCHSRL
ncbi:hypothetical protein K456DRAFT_991194 [Colletotrichum gloeosporioides 23]|nr:hypothetical protein K456DRAFT_991194 [Colletotrichum gloeosporioides 23]